MNIAVPNPILYVLEQLENNGFEAYLVGGCVRDALLNKEPHDWDVATSALPQQTMAVFQKEKVIKTGLQHGTVTVIKDHQPIEITTYRVDGSYADGRRPTNVTFTPSLTEDLARRDFTINAIAYHPIKGIVDPFGGIRDLQSNSIRCVGAAKQRFQEDALRIMRALRFSSTLNFTIETETAAALNEEKQQLEKIAAERVREELVLLLCGKNCAAVLTKFVSILAVWIPELLPMIGFEQHTPYHAYDVWEHTVHTVAASNPTPTLRMTMLLHDIGKPLTFTQDENGVGHFYGHGSVSTKLANMIMRRLKFDNDTREQVVTLVKYHDIRCQASPIWIKKQLGKFGAALFLQLLDVHQADITGQNPDLLHRLEDIEACKRMTREILAQPPCFTIKDLAVNGTDLLQLGFPKGKVIGDILSFLLNAVMEEACKNTRQDLLQYAIQHKKQFI